ncbi:MAG: c-type cytochrome [Acidobacteriota bacterium]|nr:c-type cytochrome [Acidobacteriota bacterium]
MLKSIPAVGAILFFAFSASAQYPVYPSNPTPEQAAAQERGKAIFQQNCAVCHGENLTGGRGPDLIRSVLTRQDKNGDLIGPVVTQGRPEKGMPPFSQLTQSQISDLVDFIHSQITVFDLHTRIPGAYPNDIPPSQLATGDAEAGKAFFNGAGHCSSCHSPTGDLARIAEKYPDPTDLEQRFINPAGTLVFASSYNPKTTTTATVTLKSGKTFEGPVIQNGEFYVAIRGSDGWTHTWPRNDIARMELHNPVQAHLDMIPKWTNEDMHNMFSYLETLK